MTGFDHRYPILIWIFYEFFLGSGTINIYSRIRDAEDRQDPFPTLVVEACGGHSRRLGKQIKMIQNISKSTSTGDFKMTYLPAKIHRIEPFQLWRPFH